MKVKVGFRKAYGELEWVFTSFYEKKQDPKLKVMRKNFRNDLINKAEIRSKL